MIRKWVASGLIALAVTLSLTLEASAGKGNGQGSGHGNNPPCEQGYSQTGDCDHNDDGHGDNGCNGEGNPHCVTPTPEPTVVPTSTPAPTQTPAPTPEPTPTATPTPTPTVTPTPEVEDEPECGDNPVCRPVIVVIDNGAIVDVEEAIGPLPLGFSYVYDAYVTPPEVTEAISTAVVFVPTPPKSGNAGLR